MVELTEHLKKISVLGGKRGWMYLSPQERKARIKKMQDALAKKRLAAKKND